FIELGNEERIDDKYVARFKPMAEAIWAKDPKMTIVVGDFVYKQPITDPMHFGGAASGITSFAGQAEVLKFAKAHDREVWFDIHVSTDGPDRAGDLKALHTICEAFDKVANGAKHSVVVFEFNAHNHAQRRAVANAVGTHMCERLGLPVVTSANGLQPDGQNDNSWDQGLLFLNPSQVWLQPPGYTTQMLSRAFQPLLLPSEVAGSPEHIDVAGKRSDDGKTLVVELVNTSGEACDTTLELAGFKPSKKTAQVEQLAGPVDTVNTADDPRRLVPQKSEWAFDATQSPLPYRLPPYSFTVIRFE
ncbi:MAG TPA: alpha-L-arabinofuranosidase C-terminal domain-containing protein, partial [Pirellulales bacterium]|nr:alpha-L-arabinofuranosidase C-terminal domain-containing protein [Pirellulales bacterium]